MIARQEFIKQLSLWDEDEDSSEEDTKQVPLPGGIEQKEIVKYLEHSEFQMLVLRMTETVCASSS